MPSAAASASSSRSRALLARGSTPGSTRRLTRSIGLPGSTPPPSQRRRRNVVEGAMPEPVTYERIGAAALLRIVRPERRNAVDGPTADALHAAFTRFVG